MGPRSFTLSMTFLGGLTLLAASPAGAMLGFFIGIAIAFFIAPLIWGISIAVDARFDTVAGTVFPIIGAIYVVGLLVLGLSAIRRWRSGKLHEARRSTAQVAVMIAAPLIVWLSAQSLSNAWPH